MNLTFNYEELRKNKILICTPMYGGMANGLYVKSLLSLQNLLNHHGIFNGISFLFNESLITRARNYMADEFLRGDYTHLLFIDSDIDFNPIDIVAMLHLDKDIIGAPYPKKSIKWGNIDKAYKKAHAENKQINPEALSLIGGDYVVNWLPGTKDFKFTEPQQVLEIGTGMMLIKRSVLEDFREEYPHLRYKPDHGHGNFDGSRYIHAFFDTVIDPDTHRYLSEDYMFCQYCRAIGKEIWLCPWMKLTHVGTHPFVGDIPAIANMVGNL